jgi:hypothetical protein
VQQKRCGSRLPKGDGYPLLYFGRRFASRPLLNAYGCDYRDVFPSSVRMVLSMVEITLSSPMAVLIIM